MLSLLWKGKREKENSTNVKKDGQVDLIRTEVTITINIIVLIIIIHYKMQEVLNSELGLVECSLGITETVELCAKHFQSWVIIVCDSSLLMQEVREVMREGSILCFQD